MLFQEFIEIAPFFIVSDLNNYWFCFCSLLELKVSINYYFLREILLEGAVNGISWSTILGEVWHIEGFLEEISLFFWGTKLDAFLFKNNKFIAPNRLASFLVNTFWCKEFISLLTFKISGIVCRKTFFYFFS